MENDIHGSNFKNYLNLVTKKKSFPFCVAILSFLICPIIITGASKAAANGSFIQPNLCSSWSDARWQQEFTAMKNAGMHYLIIQYVAQSSPGKITITYYPSGLPNTGMVKGIPDMVDACLRNAQSSGIKVFIGIDSSDKWWNLSVYDSTWLYNQMYFDNKVCDELWSLYKNKYPDTFYGWYWAYEVDNVRFATQAMQQVLIKAMNIQLDHLTSTKEKLPFMWSPFMNSKLGGPQAYQSIWQNVLAGLRTSAGDIFCPQDCIGTGNLNLSNLTAWFSALRSAVNTKAGLIMWSDVETFEVYQNNYFSATMDRFISQLKIEQPYVDDYVTFAYCHYYSPNNTDPGFQTTYISYLNTGSLETSSPATPVNFTAVLQANDVALNWNASSDNIGVCGYYVYRDGIMIGRKQVPRLDGNTNITPLTSFTDKGLSPNTTYTYQVKAYDFANNVSDPTISIDITTASVNIISHGSKYTVSIPADANYPDLKSSKLTDGIYSSRAYYADPAWVGFSDPIGNNIDVVIDLGRIMPLQFFTADYLLDPQPAVFLPKGVKVLVSTDNKIFADVGTLSPNIPYDTLASIYKYYYTASVSVNARFIKFSTTPNGYWTFCDEFEIGNINTTGISEQNDLPQSFSLSQNYPNPFNPTATIRYDIPKAGFVEISVYDILGREVKVLVNEEKNPGRYEITFDGKNLVSGIYIYTIRSENFFLSKKMILLR
ncbi:MAG: DUF4434 domain-containing protein [Ignavibacteriales bacterium]|nr:DUF4434 domain-containing protein [Ignavibacteriales bacterium]